MEAPNHYPGTMDQNEIARCVTNYVKQMADALNSAEDEIASLRKEIEGLEARIAGLTKLQKGA